MADKTTDGQNGEKTVAEKIREVKEKKDVLEKAKKAAAGLLEDKEDILEKPKDAVKEQYRRAAKAAMNMRAQQKEEVSEGPVSVTKGKTGTEKNPDPDPAETLRKEIVSGCRAEMERDRERNRTQIRWMVTAGVFFACLTLYTTAMTINCLGWIDSLNSSVSNMQMLMLQENNAVHSRIKEFDRRLDRDRDVSKKTENSAIPESFRGIPLFNKKSARARIFPVIESRSEGYCRNQTAEVFRPRRVNEDRFEQQQFAEQQAIEQAEAEQAALQQMNAINRAAKNRAGSDEAVSAENRAELAVVNQAREIAGITYDMYAGASKSDRINILATHFSTNIVLMEYMLKTMAVNSGVKGQPRTQEQTEANLRAILQTEAGLKMQAAYGIWEALRDDPRALAEIDRRLIENRFYGYPFIAAVEKAIIQE